MAISINIKGKVKFPKIDTSKELKHIADEIVIAQIVGGIQHKIDISGKTYKRLAQSTINRKEKTGMADPEHPLIATGKLHRSFEAKKRGNKVFIRIKNERKLIAKYLQVEGVKSKKYGKRKFKFFGISKKMEKDALNYMDKVIERYAKNA